MAAANTDERPDSAAAPVGDLYTQVVGDLTRLDDSLRAEGLTIGPDRWQNAVDLLFTLRAEGRAPTTIGAYRQRLRLLFCSSLEERRTFDVAFDGWVEGGAWEDASAQAAASSARRRDVIPKPPVAPGQFKRAAIALAAVLLMVSAAVFGPAVWQLATQPNIVVPPSPPPTPPPGGGGGGTSESQQNELIPKPLPPRAAPSTPEVPASWSSLLAGAKILFIGLPAIVLFGWLLSRWLLWQDVLRRNRGAADEPVRSLILDRDDDDLLSDAPLRAALRRLHGTVARPSRRLDGGATTKATARNAGLYSPVTRAKRVTPECLVLIDSHHRGDQMAGFADQLVDRLHEAGLELARYDFEGEPAVLFDQRGRLVSLEALAVRHRGARLLIIGEPAGLIDHWTGQPHAWAAHVDAWPARALLLTRRPSQSNREAIETLEFAVAELGRHGLENIARFFTSGASPSGAHAVDDAAPPTLPAILRDAALAHRYPAREERDDLLKTLRRYLDDEAQILLAAMAFYPELHWGLTRILDAALFPEQDAATRERRLRTVARLPWSRAGFFPDWFREAAITSRSRQERDRVRDIFESLLSRLSVGDQADAKRGERVAVALPVVVPSSGGALLRWFRAFKDIWGEGWINAWRHLRRDDDPLNDRIFVEQIFGWQRRLFEAALPHNIVEKLQPMLRAAVPRAVGGAALAGLCMWGMSMLWAQWVGPWASDQPFKELANAKLVVLYRAAGDDSQRDLTPYADALITALSSYKVNEITREQIADTSTESSAASGTGTDAITAPENAVFYFGESNRAAAEAIHDVLKTITWGTDVELRAPTDGTDASEERPLVVRISRQPTGISGFTFSDPLVSPWVPPKDDTPVTPPTPTVTADLQRFRDPLASGGFAPDMIALPGGDFVMGSPETEAERYADEGPQRTVTIAPFALSRTEVTFAQYDQFADATGRKKPSDAGWGRGERPVINVTWNDAQAYVAWLSDETKERYRLPTEAEWEYAVRAGTTTPFSSGECIDSATANYNGAVDYNGCGANTGVYREQTVAAGTLKPNPWGLHDMHGNVWEWVQDCWIDNYAGAPVDGSAREVPPCDRRVVRGGGWFSDPGFLRSADRSWNDPDDANYNVGFRVARAL